MADEEKKSASTKDEEAATEATEAEEKQEESAPAEEKTEETASEADETDTANETSEAEVEIPEKFKALIEQIEEMSVLELNELVKTLEKRFGVSAAAVAAAPAGGGDAGASEEQSEFTVALTSAGDQKIQVIKVVKEVLGLGLKEAKDLVDGAPADLKAGVAKEEAEEMKSKIEEAGGAVELK